MKFSISRTEWGMVLGIQWVEVFSVSSFLPSFSLYERKVIKSGKMKSQPQATGHSIPKDQSSCHVMTDKRSDSGTEETVLQCLLGAPLILSTFPIELKLLFSLQVMNGPNIPELIILKSHLFSLWLPFSNNSLIIQYNNKRTIPKSTLFKLVVSLTKKMHAVYLFKVQEPYNYLLLSLGTISFFYDGYTQKFVHL